jgi:hypothetical protein
MAYSTPKQWSHGDTVPAAEMQKYSDGLDAIKPMIGETHYNWVILYSNMEDAQEFWLVHKKRWLIYKSTGVVRHASDTTTYPDVSLSDTGGICAADLDQEVDWLVPGQLYSVIGCSVCYEDDEGIIT